MTLDFNGEIWFWKGPAPWHFVTVPVEAWVRRAERLDVGDVVTVRLTVEL